MEVRLKARERDNSRKSIVKQLRDEGKLPGVVYGRKLENKPVYLDSIEFTKTMREVGRNGVITLDVEGSKHSVIVTDIQKDILKDAYIHADFQEVDMNIEIDADVPVRIVGEPLGAKEGGILQHLLRDISVSALPADIPTEIEIDVSELQIGDALTVGGYKEGSTLQINSNSEEVIVSVIPPTLEEEEETEAEDAQEDPEPEIVGQDDNENK
jgi:large subunit ribosomal protein L25